MAFDFPSSPAEGQIFNAPGGPSYVFNTPVWKAVGQGQIAIISDTPPPSPANGALWLESDTGILFIWWNDGNSSQWVQVGGVAAGPTVKVTLLPVGSGNYVKPVGLRFLEVWAVGGGGAGSRAGSTGVSQASAGGGGGGGGLAYQFYAANDLAASEPYTVGAPGIGGASAGTGGSATTFKGLTASGGQGGGALMPAQGAFSVSSSGSGGSGSGGLINMRGGSGTSGLANLGGVGYAKQGSPGSSFFAPFVEGTWAGPGSAANPATPRGLGGGSGGGANGASIAAPPPSENGGDGAIILKEYF